MPIGATQYWAYPPPATSAHTLLSQKLLRALSRLGHFAGDLETEDIGRARRRRVEPAALQEVGTVHSSGGDFDQYLLASGPRYGPLDQLQLLGPVGLRGDHRHHGGRDFRHGAVLIDFGRTEGQRFWAMDLDDLFPSKPDDPLVALAKQDLDPLSIEELKERIEALKAEIARVEAHMQRAQSHRSEAEELFKKN